MKYTLSKKIGGLKASLTTFMYIAHRLEEYGPNSLNPFDVNHFWEKSEVYEGGKLIRTQLLSAPSHIPFSLLSELQNSQILMRDLTHKYELTEKWVHCINSFFLQWKKMRANVGAVKMTTVKTNCHSNCLYVSVQ